MGFLEFLKWMFSKDARYVPLLALSEGTEDGEKGLWFSCEGDYNSECCEIVERLCAGRYAVTWMEDLFWKDERQGKKKREIIYHTTFPMYYQAYIFLCRNGSKAPPAHPSKYERCCVHGSCSIP